jgi:hypothetical protein
VHRSLRRSKCLTTASPRRDRSRFRASTAVAVLAAVGLAVGGSVVSQSEALSVALPTGATPAQADAKAGTSEVLLPDLTPLRASHLSIQHVRGGGRELRFEGTLANVGTGPLELVTNRARPCPRGKRHASQVIYRDVDGNHHYKRAIDKQSKRKSAGCFLFHVEHNHWHFDAAARYRLFKPNVTGHIAQAKKVSFCLRDSERVPAAMGEFHQRRYYGDCSLDRAEGITVGWSDVYESFLSGQSLRLPPRVRRDVYCLSVKVDPKSLLYESDETNNISYRGFRIKGARTVVPYPNKVCERQPAPQ